MFDRKHYRQTGAVNAWVFLGVLLSFMLVGGGTVQAQEWEPAEARLMTRWGSEVSPESVQERPYPRPQMKRSRWKTLNGLWEYALVPEGEDVASFDGDILVPFPVEAPLSGVGATVEPSQEVVYRRTFEVPDGWDGDRLLMHFGAVDWRAVVHVNGQEVGRHEGGYDPFAVDVTEALRDAGPAGVAGHAEWRCGGQGTPDLDRSEADREQFETELREMVDDFYNHPSVVTWVVFNEGWGQYDTPRVTRMVEEMDPTRLVSNVSGWTDRGAGDVRDVHMYPGPGAPPAEEDRALVLGEFGGRGLPVSDHTWQGEENWGHAGTADSPAGLAEVYRNQIEDLRLSIDEPGLSAAVYTQITDVEIEVNGLLTYDRDVRKLNSHRLAQLNRSLYEESPPEVTVLASTSRQGAVTWRYTTSAPGNGWMNPEHDDSGWSEGPGGFGSEGTPGTQIGTEWTTSDLWVRRTFAHGEAPPQNLYLRVHHDDAATVYLNGQNIAELEGAVTGYRYVKLGPDAQQALRQGQNTLAIHVHDQGGNQYLDAGLVEVSEEAASMSSSSATENR